MTAVGKLVFDDNNTTRPLGVFGVHNFPICHCNSGSSARLWPTIRSVQIYPKMVTARRCILGCASYEYVKPSHHLPVRTVCSILDTIFSTTISRFLTVWFFDRRAKTICDG